MLLLGFVTGFATGTVFYKNYLDKPTHVIGKQKNKGRNNTNHLDFKHDH